MTKVYKSLGIIGAILIILGGVFLYTQIQKSSKRYAETKKQLDAALLEEAELKALQQAYERMKPEVEEINRVLPENSIDVANFLEQISSIASSSGVTMEISIEDEKQDSDVAGAKRVFMENVVRGGFGNSVNYINQIARLSYYVKFNKLEMERNRDGQIESIIDIELFTL